MDSLRLENRNQILICDDNEFMNNSLKIIIDNIIIKFKLNYRVISCNDGVDILKLLIDDQFNGNLIKLIITDENMEFINGSDAIKLIRKMEMKNKIKETKIISLTSFEDICFIDYLYKIGFDYVLKKPVDNESLHKILNDLIILDTNN